jgi:cystathionine beta-lyase/cystathionine gamma-synthase
MRGFGGMMSFTLKDDSIAAATKVLSSTKIFSLAESSGFEKSKHATPPHCGLD